MDDKFGYNEMKNVVDHDAMEEQKRQEDLDKAYNEWVYNNMRAEAQQKRTDALNDLNSKFDNKYNNVAAQPAERQQVVSISSMLDSVQDKEYLAKHQQESEMLEREKFEAQEKLNNRNMDYFSQLYMEFELVRRQRAQIVERDIEPTLTQKIKEKAKKALPYILAGSIAIGSIAAGVSAFTQSEPVQKDNFHPDSIEDVIEHRDQQIESGITTNPEHVIEDNYDYSDNQSKGGRGF